MFLLIYFWYIFHIVFCIVCQALCINMFLLHRHRMDRIKTEDVGGYNHRLLLWLWLHFSGRCGVSHKRLA